jgi:FixJ family two-component response regulator
VLSGTTDVHAAGEARRMGAAEFLSKPVDENALYQAINRVAGTNF